MVPAVVHVVAVMLISLNSLGTLTGERVNVNLLACTNRSNLACVPTSSNESVQHNSQQRNSALYSFTMVITIHKKDPSGLISTLFVPIIMLCICTPFPGQALQGDVTP